MELVPERTYKMELLIEAGKTVIGLLTAAAIAWLWALHSRVSKEDFEKLTERLNKCERDLTQKISGVEHEVAVHVTTVTVQMAEIKAELGHLEKMMNQGFESIKERM